MKPDYAARLRVLSERAWWSSLDLVFPPRCAHCQQVGERLCVTCRAQIEYISGSICRHCGYPLLPNTPVTDRCDECRRNPFQGQGLRSLAVYSGPLRSAIHSLKYKHNPALAELLAALMAQGWPADLPTDAILMPVPLSLERRHERGFNQAELLAQQLGNYRQLPVVGKALRRDNATRSQVGLDARQRRQNMAEAFSAESQFVQDCAIILIDDVCTTGATLGACAEALLKSGARWVWAYTLARAPFADADKPF